MSVKTRVHRRRKVRRTKLRRSSSCNAVAAKKDARQQNQHDASVMIGGALDPAEKSADQMAAKALSGESAATGGQGASQVHRQCAECKEEEKAKREPSATPSVASGNKATPATSNAAHSIRSLGAGRPLSTPERSFYEPRFNRDFSSVRIHEGERADKAAQQIDAKAFTYGNNIAFAQGEKEKGGQQIMAHELAHVVQDQGREGNAKRQAEEPAAEAPEAAAPEAAAPEAAGPEAAAPEAAAPEAAAAAPENCENCPNPVNPEVTVTITPLIQNGNPAPSPFGATRWGSASMRQLSVWHRERRTCDTCDTPNGQRPQYDLCPRKINALATVPLVIDRAEITRNDPATGRDWYTECGPGPGADSFNTATGTGFADPKQKTVAGVIHHERYHVGVSERLLRQRIQARNDIHQLCPYRSADIQAWKTALEATIRADAEAFLQGNPNEANEETNASTAECTQY